MNGNGKKRPCNASLKALSWKIGKSFVLTASNSDNFYGKLYQYTIPSKQKDTSEII